MCPKSLCSLYFALLGLECAFPVGSFFFFYFFFFTNTGKETKFLLFSDPERIFFIYFSLYFYKKCRYLSGIKKKHTKAPVSLCFTAVEENNSMKKKTKRCSIKSESGTPAITEVFEVEFLSLSARVHPALLWQPLRNIAATLSAHCPADALEVSMATRMASRDCEGQSEPINGTMLRDKKKKKSKIRIKSQIMLLVTFIPALPKMSVCVCFMFACFPSLPLSYCLCKPVMTVCCQCIGCTGGRTWMPFFFLGHWLFWLLTTMLLLHCKAKAL